MEDGFKMNVNELFKLNEIDGNTVQIYGTVNGFAKKFFDMERWVYIYDIKFIKNNKLYKISNHNIRTLSTLKSLEEKLLKIYNNEN